MERSERAYVGEGRGVACACGVRAIRQARAGISADAIPMHYNGGSHARRKTAKLFPADTLSACFSPCEHMAELINASMRKSFNGRLRRVWGGGEGRRCRALFEGPWQEERARMSVHLLSPLHSSRLPFPSLSLSFYLVSSSPSPATPSTTASTALCPTRYPSSPSWTHCESHTHEPEAGRQAGRLQLVASLRV